MHDGKHINEMTDEETKTYLLQWCDDPNFAPLEHPTDGCGYDQHMKFVEFKNKHWDVSEDFVEFVRRYANTL